MNDNAKLWVEALESGQYKQGRGLLNQEIDGVNQYCCLGVACEVYNKANPDKELCVEKINTQSPFNEVFNVLYDKESAFLPKIVQEWLGLKSINGSYIEGTVSITVDNKYSNTSISIDNKLTTQNDSGKSFKEIAGLIKSNPSGLFV